MRSPLNAVWALPYIALRKIVDSLKKLGIAHWSRYLEGLPSGIRTRSQIEVESLRCDEILGLQEKRILKMLDSIEEALYLRLRRRARVADVAKQAIAASDKT